MKLNDLMLILAILTTLVVAWGFEDCKTAKRVLTEAGYTRIQFTGINHLGCGAGDIYRTGYTAVSNTGATVSGTVCAGWFKNSTIRFD